MIKYTLERLEQDIDSLLMQEPFYGHIFQGTGRVITPALDTAAVAWNGQMYVLYVNPEFFGQLKLHEKLAVLKHEVLHIVFRHLTRGKTRDPHVFNIAADLAINQLCAGLPAGALDIADFQPLGMVRNGTAEEYYDLLLKNQPPRVKKRTPKKGKDGDKGDGKDGAGKGGEDKQGEGDSNWEAFWKSQSGKIGSHQKWGEQMGVQGEEVVADWKAGDLALRARDMTEARQAGSWGRMPAAIQLELQKIDEERRPRVDWKQMLRTFVSGSSHTKLRTTMSRPSRRFGTHPGTRIKRNKRLLVAVDTSGSTEGLREMFFEELRHIWKQGVEIWVVECDAHVGAHYPFKGETPKTLTGGGGTAFQPVFDWMLSGQARSAPHGGQFDGCVYFTDGYGPTPTRPPLCRIMWVLPPWKYNWGGEEEPSQSVQERWKRLTPGTVVEMSE